MGLKIHGVTSHAPKSGPWDAQAGRNRLSSRAQSAFKESLAHATPHNHKQASKMCVTRSYCEVYIDLAPIWRGLADDLAGRLVWR